jgi:putative FmdB family regulatory protein
MPIYEYQCTKCDHHLEALQKISDKPLRECPECGKHSLKRLMSAPMFRLAGSGWYETDFKSDKEQKRNLAGDKGESAGGTDATAKVEPKTDTKTDTKAETKPEAKAEAKTEARADSRKDAAPVEKKPSRRMIAKPSVKPASGRAGKTKPAARKAAGRSGKR